MSPAERAATWERLRVQLEDAAVNWLFYLECEPNGTHHRARYAAHCARLALDAYEALRADDETPCLCCREMQPCQDGCGCRRPEHDDDAL